MWDVLIIANPTSASGIIFLLNYAHKISKNLSQFTLRFRTGMSNQIEVATITINETTIAAIALPFWWVLQRWSSDDGEKFTKIPKSMLYVKSFCSANKNLLLFLFSYSFPPSLVSRLRVLSSLPGSEVYLWKTIHWLWLRRRLWRWIKIWHTYKTHRP